REPVDAIPFQRQFSLPHRLTATAAVLRTLPGDAHAAAEIGSCKGTRRLHDLAAMQHVDAIDRRGADDFSREPHRHLAGAEDVAKECFANCKFLGGRELGVLGKAGDRLLERAAQIEEYPRAGGAVVAPPAQRREQSIARKLRHEVAGQPADRAEGRGARPRRARSPLVVVAVAYDADAVAFFERVVQQPFERAPGRVHLDAALEPSVMGGFDVGVTPADMGDDNGILPAERTKQFIRRVHGAARGLSFDQDVRRAPDRAAFAAEENVAIAAHAGIARPFVAGHAYEPARRVECGRQAVELGPECVGDLEIVALMADDVDESEIARIAEIAVRRAHADGFAALPVQIAPVAPQRGVRDRAQRTGAGKLLAIGDETQLEIAGRIRDQIVEDARAIAALDRNALRQAADRLRGYER